MVFFSLLWFSYTLDPFFLVKPQWSKRGLSFGFPRGTNAPRCVYLPISTAVASFVSVYPYRSPVARDKGGDETERSVPDEKSAWLSFTMGLLWFQAMIPRFWLICDYLSDLMFVVDVLVQFRTGYLEQGIMVYDSKKLAFHYLFSRAFLLDIAALCPLDLLQFTLGAHPLLRFPRFLKVSIAFYPQNIVTRYIKLVFP